MPIGHLGLNIPDLTRARAYYDRLMPAVDFEFFFADDDQFSYRPAGKPGTVLFFYRLDHGGDYSRQRAGLQHLAFMVNTRSDVDRVHVLVRELGSEVLHEPRVFPQ